MQRQDPVPPLTLGGVVDLFVTHEKKRKAGRGFDERCAVLELFKEKLGDFGVAEAKPFHLADWVADHPEWKSDWTIRRVYATVKRPFQWAVDMGLIERHPFGRLSNPPGRRGKPVTAEQWQTMLRGTTSLFRRVLLFQALTGARPGEMSALAWDQIDWARGVATLREHKTERRRKDRAPRVIVLHPVVVRLLAWMYRQEWRHDTCVFLNSRGGPWNRGSLGLRIYRLREKLGIPKDVKLYGLRHLFATNAILGGADLATTAQLMGHTSTKMTEHYLHLAGQIDHLHRAAEDGARKMRTK